MLTILFQREHIRWGIVGLISLALYIDTHLSLISAVTSSLSSNEKGRWDNFDPSCTILRFSHLASPYSLFHPSSRILHLQKFASCLFG